VARRQPFGQGLRAVGRFLWQLGPPTVARFAAASAVSALRYRSLGASLSVDASTHCQLNCPACSQARGELGVVGRGNLDPADLRNLLDSNPAIRNLELSNYGEIFLNPGLVEILSLARERRVSATALNGVNLNTVADHVLEALVRQRMLFLVVSLDGASPATYQEYRRGGDFGRVLSNIQRINHFKQKLGSPFPHLIWQFVVFSHNRHELPLARSMSRDLGMGFLSKRNWSSTYSPLPETEPENAAADVGYVPGARRRGRQRVLALPVCAMLWYSPQVNWDGKLLGCCANKSRDFGNVFTSGLGECLRGERYRYAKRMVLDLVPPRADIPCTTCSTFHRLEADRGRFLGSRLLRMLLAPLT